MSSEQTLRCYNHLIQMNREGVVLIDRKQTDFKSLEEARKYIKNKKLSENLEQEITREIYEEITDTRIANIIREYHDVKVTDTLIENYIDLASSKIFTVDPVVQKIRTLNKLDVVVENKNDCILNDGSVIVISDSLQEELNTLLCNNKDVVEYMRESKENFLHVLEKFKE
jgi:hypothetical protein